MKEMMMMMMIIIIIIIIKCPERLWGPFSFLLNASLVYVNLGVEGTKHVVPDVL